MWTLRKKKAKMVLEHVPSRVVSSGQARYSRDVCCATRGCAGQISHGAFEADVAVPLTQCAPHMIDV